VFASTVAPLGLGRGPDEIVLDIPALVEAATAAESELRARALVDVDGCCGYFPALAEVPGIRSDLPACSEFATRLPQLRCAGAVYLFNFLRLSVVQQSADPVYHLDSDAGSAITGDVTTLRRRRILRLLLNLSMYVGRSLHYLDVDPWSVQLAAEGSYICAVRPATLRPYARVVTIPPRRGSTVHGVAFASNGVLHSGVDDRHGHFIAAYGIEADTAVV
jgi:hypothetical protein